MAIALRRVVVTALLVALVACGQQDGSEEPGAAPPGSSYEATWRLVDGHGPRGEVPVVNRHGITLTIAAGRVEGTAACNRYGGDATVDGTAFAASDLAMTEMACAPRVMESESAYIAALSAVDRIARRGTGLTLTGDGTQLRFELVPPVPTAELTATSWALEALIRGAGRDGAVSSARPAQLVLTRDGRMTGSTGCRRLRGRWVEKSGEILFTRLAAEGHCSEELRAQDDHVVAVLGDGFTARIRGDRLTALAGGELGLRYRATAP